ncbi:hypothetical protein NE562_05535 [Butyricicoccus faecihominis]|uniref:hypothetical protein n=1 Tax=Butyricicoccus faecihominis TaxID=1712515 RepID=UPI002479C5CB|nr:hypothetical protein [Butyricicoccus faecihominis]MCQ5129114.1 hypothetical protein [Butyricicoccus faecihominis]
MTYNDFMDVLRPLIIEAFEDGRQGNAYDEDALSEWNMVYSKEKGRPMTEREKRLFAGVGRKLMPANREGLKFAKEKVT